MNTQEILNQYVNSTYNPLQAWLLKYNDCVVGQLYAGAVIMSMAVVCLTFHVKPALKVLAHTTWVALLAFSFTILFTSQTIPSHNTTERAIAFIQKGAFTTKIEAQDGKRRIILSRVGKTSPNLGTPTTVEETFVVSSSLVAFLQKNSNLLNESSKTCLARLTSL